VLGNAGSIIAFRVGAEDAPYLVREFQETFGELDLMQMTDLEKVTELILVHDPPKVTEPFEPVSTDGVALPSANAWAVNKRVQITARIATTK
jgi:hypothetical protein